jgi:hypothetical protein
VSRKWDDLRAPATGINPPGQASDPDWDLTNIGFLFDKSSTESVQIVLQLPHGYIEGTFIYPHIHWEPTDTDTGDVLWRMSYKWRNNHEVDAGFTTVEQLAPGSGIANRSQINGFGAIGKEDATISSMFECTISRIGGDASDTYDNDARFKEFDIHVQLDDFGSNEERSS